MMTMWKDKVHKGKVWEYNVDVWTRDKKHLTYEAGSGNEQERDTFQEHFKGRIEHGKRLDVEG